MIWIAKKPKVSDPGILVCSTPLTTYNRMSGLDTGILDRRDSIIRRAFREVFPSRFKPRPSPKIFTTQGVDSAGYEVASGTLLNTYTTGKSVINNEAITPCPGNKPFWYVGKTLRITVIAGVSNIVTTPGTMTMTVNLGPTIGTAATVFSTGAIQLNATAHTTLPAWVDIFLTLQVMGSGTTAKFMGMGRVQGIMFTLTAAQIDAVNTGGIFSAPATLPAQGSGFDSSVGNNLDFWNAFSINNAGNGWQTQIYTVEALN